MSENRIHPRAWLEEGVRLGRGNEIGPFAVIEAGVELGDGNVIHAHAVLKRGTRLGNRNRVHEHAVLGGAPQDLGFDPATESFLEIGDDSVLREGVTLHRGSRAGAVTRIGDACYLMANVHAAHDCQLGKRVIMATDAALGGHVQVDDGAFISGGVMVHQFTRIGRLAMLGGNAKVIQDVLPFCLVDGVPARVRGLNLVGLKRAGFDRDALRELKRAYRSLFRAGAHRDEALAALSASPSEQVREWAAFIESSRRGYHREREASA